jgi:EmrB/QacA subfamily drug resistance transporter
MSDVRGPFAKRGNLILLVLCLAQFMLTLDVAVVTVALPQVQRDLHVQAADLQWVSTAYTLAFGGFLMLSGRAGDIYGRRRMFTAGLTLFTLASLACGTSQDAIALFAARAVQGLGAAIVAPAALSLLTTSFSEGPERNRALGIWGAIASGGAIVGQLLGGVVADLLGWRWIFFINLPFGVLVLLIGLRLFPHDRPEGRTRLDLSGAFTLTGGLVLLVYAVTTLASPGSHETALITVAAGVLLLILFVLAEQRHPEPLVRLALLRNPAVSAGNVINIVNAATSNVMVFFATLYLQQVLRLSPLITGLCFAPVTVVIMVVASRTQRLVARFGVRTLLIAGAVCIAVGALWLTRLRVDGNYPVDVFPGLLLIGLGSALSFAPSMILATTGVADSDQGLASGMVSTSQQLGGAVGLAIFASAAAARAHGSSPAQLVQGYRWGYLLAISLPALMAISAALTRSRSSAPTSDGPAEEPAEQNV